MRPATSCTMLYLVPIKIFQQGSRVTTATTWGFLLGLQAAHWLLRGHQRNNSPHPAVDWKGWYLARFRGFIPHMFLGLTSITRWSSWTFVHGSWCPVLSWLIPLWIHHKPVRVDRFPPVMFVAVHPTVDISRIQELLPSYTFANRNIQKPINSRGTLLICPMYSHFIADELNPFQGGRKQYQWTTFVQTLQFHFDWLYNIVYNLQHFFDMCGHDTHSIPVMMA